MALTQLNFTKLNKVEVALMRLREFEPIDGYFLAFSGGKDSVVLHDLSAKAGVKFDTHYNVTGIDPPELVYFIRDHYPDMINEKPKENIWKLIEQNGLPRRTARFCCKYLKEHTGAGRVMTTGIRWQESGRRRQRRMVETCRYLVGKSYLHPIIDWTTADVWEYIKQEKLPYCSLYDEGFRRLGCVLCPMTTPQQTRHAMERWPKIAEAWYRATVRFYNRGTKSGNKFSSADDLWAWWLSRKGQGNNNQCQAMFI